MSDHDYAIGGLSERVTFDKRPLHIGQQFTFTPGAGADYAHLGLIQRQATRQELQVHDCAGATNPSLTVE